MAAAGGCERRPRVVRGQDPDGRGALRPRPHDRQPRGPERRGAGACGRQDGQRGRPAGKKKRRRGRESKAKLSGSQGSASAWAVPCGGSGRLPVLLLTDFACRSYPCPAQCDRQLLIDHGASLDAIDVQVRIRGPHRLALVQVQSNRHSFTLSVMACVTLYACAAPRAPRVCTPRLPAATTSAWPTSWTRGVTTCSRRSTWG